MMSSVRSPTYTLFLLRPDPQDLGERISELVLRHRIAEALGPRVNLVPLHGQGDGLGRGGLSTRTVYEINMHGHGVVVFGATDTGPEIEPEIDLDPEACKLLTVPVLVCGVVGRGPKDALKIAGLDLHGLKALAGVTTAATAAEPGALFGLHSAAPTQALLTGPMRLFVDRLPPGGILLDEPEGTGALVVIRNPARLPLPAKKRTAVHAQVRAIADMLQSQGHEDVRLLCQHPTDVAFAAAYGIDYFYCDDPYTFLDVVQTADIVVSYRLEAALAAASYGRPMVHLASDEASRSVMRTVGLSDWSVDLTAADAVEAVAGLAKTHEELSLERVRLLPNWSEYDRRAHEAFGAFADAVIAQRKEEANDRRFAQRLPPEKTRAPFAVVETKIDLLRRRPREPEE